MAADRADGAAPDARIRVAAEQTLPRMVAGHAAADPVRLVFRENRHGYWRGISWGELEARMRWAALALIERGFAAGARACVLSNNRPEWCYADLAAMAAGGICVGIYPTCPPAQVEYHLADSGSAIVFVEDDRQLDKVLEVRDRLPGLIVVVFDMTGLHAFSDPGVISFDDFLAEGRAQEERLGAELDRRLAERRPEDAALIVYTSGTTGPAKGALVSHRAIMLQLATGAALFGFGPQDERLSYLPLCHAAERVWSLFMGLYTRATVNFVETLDTLMENAGEVRPTVMLAVPRIWEKFHSFIELGVREAPALQQAAYRWSIAIGRRHAEARRAERRPGLALGLAYAAARLAVLDNVRAFLGLGRCRLAITGAAPVSRDLILWYRALGIEMVEGYGQTEASGMIAIGLPGDFEPGTVGRPLPGTELRLSPSGEILLRADSLFLGYFGRPEASAETIVDGWLHTGDIGLIEDGRLRIVDRVKDVIITAGGKNVSPSEIENQLKFSPYIGDAVVIGDRRRYLTALILLDHENVHRFAQAKSVAYTDFASLCAAPEVEALIRAEVERVNAGLARVETVKRFRIITQMLSPEDEEMTPTMKLKRKQVARVYADLIETMYRD